MLISLLLVSRFNFLFIPCGRLSWLPVSFLLQVKYTHYRIVLQTSTNAQYNVFGGSIKNNTNSKLTTSVVSWYKQ